MLRVKQKLELIAELEEGESVLKLANGYCISIEITHVMNNETKAMKLARNCNSSAEPSEHKEYGKVVVIVIQRVICCTSAVVQSNECKEHLSLVLCMHRKPSPFMKH